MWIPIETMIRERQEEYYRVLNDANTAGESTVFVEFMLKVIRDLLFELAENETEPGSARVEDQLLELLRQDEKHSAKSLSLELGISERQVQRILKELKASSVIKREGANRNGKWIVL